MALPTVTVTGHFQRGPDTPTRGTIVFQLATPMVDENDEIIVSDDPISLPLIDGQFSVDLVPSDGTGLTPTPVPYTVTEEFGSRRSYLVTIPTQRSPVDLSSLVPLGSPPVAADLLAAETARAEAAEAAGTAALTTHKTSGDHDAHNDGRYDPLGAASTAQTAASAHADTVIATETTRAQTALAAFALSVKSYGALGDGAHDDTAAIGAAYTAAKAAVNGGWATSAVIYFPPGVFYCHPGSLQKAAILFDFDLGGQITVRGSGVGVTTVKLHANCPSFTGINDAVTGAGHVFGKFRIEDLTVDANNVLTTFRGVVLNIDTQNVNVDQITIQRVDTINVGVPVWTGTNDRRNVNISSNQAVYNGSTQYTVTNVRIADCFFGRSGGGGNAGILVSGYYNGSGGQLPNTVPLQGGLNANVWVDNVTIERVTWHSGITTYAGKSTAFDGVGIQVAGYGMAGKVRIRDVELIGSTDDLIEINTALDCVIDNCYLEDAVSEGIYLRPAFGGLPNANKQRMIVRNIRYRNNLVCGSALAAIPPAVFIHTKDFGLTAGHFVVEDVTSITDDPNALFAVGAYALRAIGGFRSLVARRVNTVLANFTATGTATTVRSVQISPHVGRGTIRVEDVGFAVEGICNAASGTISLVGLAIDFAADYRINVDGVAPRWNINNTGAGAVTTRDMTFIDTGNQNTTDNFGAATNLAQSYRADVGSLADLAVAGGLLTKTANRASESRLTWTRDDTNYTTGQVGPCSDCTVTAKFTLPTTPAAGFRAGARQKVSADGVTSIHTYVGFDGANYSINIDTEEAGVLTNRATASLGASIASPFWVRGTVNGALITADHMTAAPTAQGATPAASTSTTYTLTGTQLTSLGPLAAQGWKGLTWVPQDSGSTVDDLSTWHRNTCTLTAERVGARLAVFTGAGIASNGIRIVSVIATFARAVKKYIFRDCDFTNYAAVTEFTNASDANVVRRDIAWSTGNVPAGAGVSVTGSPFTYTNVDGYDEDVSIAGGTVSAVTATRVGAAASSVGTATGMLVRLAPGDAVTVTYTVAPTMRKLPIT